MTDPTPAQIRRLFTATLILGVSGSGKTSLLETFAEYLWETYRKILLLYSWDGGAIPTNLQKRMKQGLVWFWRAKTRSGEGLALETMYLATKGCWPKTINPQTGETAPAVELIAPVVTSYAMRCPKGHPIKTVTAASLVTATFCPECKQPVNLADLQVTETVERAKGFEQVGGVAYDGLTSMCTGVLDEMDRMRGHGHIGGEKPAFGGVVQSGVIRLGGNNRADIGFAQTRSHQFVNNSLSIPFLVEGPVFTAISAEVEESNLTVVGPKLAGTAMIDQASAWFGNVCEAAKVLDADGKERHTLYLRPFIDRDQRRHLLKTSASPTGVPDFLQDPPDIAAPFSQFSLGVMFRLLDKDLREALGGQEKPLVDVPESFGSATTAPPPTVAPPVTVGPKPPTPGPPMAGPRPPNALPMAGGPPQTPQAPKPAPATIPGPVPTGGPQAAGTSTRTPPPPGMKPPMKAPGAPEPVKPA